MAISLASDLLRKEGFRHGFSTRENDLRLEGPDAQVALERFATSLAIDPLRVRQAKQVHGARVIEASEDGPLEEADALVSRRELAVGVRVADCVPVLVADRERGHVAAIHAGWRGLTGGVIDRALDALGGTASDLVAAIGPHIGPCCFEVGEEVVRAVVGYVGEGEQDLVGRGPGGKPHVDLRAATVRALRRRGLSVRAIDHVAGCTMCDASRFFSFRREKEASGRHLALIAPRAA